MTQYRLDQAMPFACFRCGREKKSRLLTIYGDNWSRLLCNGCYGFLLSVHEIVAGDVPGDEKADRLAALLLELASADDARGVLRRQTYSRDPAAILAPEAARFLGTAEFVAEQLQGQESIEWSPAIIGLCKAVEYEVVARVLEPLRERCALLDLEQDLSDRDLKAVARWCNGERPQAPELGTVAHVLTTAANSRRRADTSPLLRTLREQVHRSSRGAWVLDADGLAYAVVELTTRFRNPAAHTGSLGASDYAACRDLVLDADGLLWRLVDATAI
jgi:hypothetical protein